MLNDNKWKKKTEPVLRVDISHIYLPNKQQNQTQNKQ